MTSSLRPRRRNKLATPKDVSLVDAYPEQAIVPYDENLLERARIQWQFGDWQSLAHLDRDLLQNHPDRAKLALLAAAGRLQINNPADARQYLRLAQDWGVSKKLVGQILASGVHNSLGRAATLAGQQTRGIKHFEAAILVGTPGADARLLTQARISQQCNELGVVPLQHHKVIRDITSGPVFRNTRCGFSVVKLAEYKLGDAWAGNSINTVIFRHHGILTHQGKQTTAFFVDARTLRLVQRDLESNVICMYDIAGEYNLRDAHNSISLGIDRSNYLHISYDHHATQLRYRKSIKPNDISSWTDELAMTGKAEDRVTYPTFILPHHGFPLMLLYRDGVHNKGTARLKAYDDESQCWIDNPTPILSGSDSKPWTSNAYWNHPVIGSDGTLHLSFVWRTHTLGKEDRINNINIGYACTPDNGNIWLTSKGWAYQLPITQVNAETVHPVSPGSNLINQCSMALDSRNRPHIVFYADDPSGVPQYQHLRFDGKAWHHQIISQRTKSFALEGHGTLQIPISRPEIVIDRQDNAYVITRGDHSQGRMLATSLVAPDYIWSPENSQIIWDEDIGFAEPIIDRERWSQENVLSLLLQHNEQPNHDVGHRSIDHPMTLLDVEFRIAKP